MAEFHERLQKVLAADSVRTEESMRDHTTFRIGGPAKYFVTPKTQKELTDTVGLCRKEAMAFYVIGNGSNLLVSDKGYEGVIISTEGLASWQAAEDGEAVLSASAGILLSRLAKAAASKSLTGLEFAAGIPGTLGGAVVMNAGAYDGEMAQVVAETRFLTSSGEVHTVANKDHQFTYRSSRFSQAQDVILSCELELRPGSTELLRTQMQELSLRRRSSQPLEWPSGGSVFKRPQGHYAAALIDQCGLKGLSVGGAQVSEKHAGFIINKGGATQADVLELVDQVRQRVLKDTGVELELELKVL